MHSNGSNEPTAGGGGGGGVGGGSGVASSWLYSPSPLSSRFQSPARGQHFGGPASLAHHAEFGTPLLQMGTPVAASSSSFELRTPGPARGAEEAAASSTLRRSLRVSSALRSASSGGRFAHALGLASPSLHSPAPSGMKVHRTRHRQEDSPAPGLGLGLGGGGGGGHTTQRLRKKLQHALNLEVEGEGEGDGDLCGVSEHGLVSEGPFGGPLGSGARVTLFPTSPTSSRTNSPVPLPTLHASTHEHEIGHIPSHATGGQPMLPDSVLPAGPHSPKPRGGLFDQHAAFHDALPPLASTQQEHFSAVAQPMTNALAAAPGQQEAPLPPSASVPSGGSVLPAPPPASMPHGQSTHKPCSCKKSKCLKLYCECFARQDFCVGCNCVGCSNTPDAENKAARDKAIIGTLERDPQAFFRAQLAAGADGGAKDQRPLSAITAHSNAAASRNVHMLAALTGGAAPAPVKLYRKGCHCRKSECLKKYCECYQAGVPCDSSCKCVDCKNGPHDHGHGHPDDRLGGKLKRSKPSGSKVVKPTYPPAPLVAPGGATLPTTLFPDFFNPLMFISPEIMALFQSNAAMQQLQTAGAAAPGLLANPTLPLMPTALMPMIMPLATPPPLTAAAAAAQPPALAPAPVPAAATAAAPATAVAPADAASPSDAASPPRSTGAAIGSQSHLQSPVASSSAPSVASTPVAPINHPGSEPIPPSHAPSSDDTVALTDATPPDTADGPMPMDTSNHDAQESREEEASASCGTNIHQTPPVASKRSSRVITSTSKAAAWKAATAVSARPASKAKTRLASTLDQLPAGGGAGKAALGASRAHAALLGSDSSGEENHTPPSHRQKRQRHAPPHLTA